MKTQMNNGVYLVINPAQNKAQIIEQLKQLKDKTFAAIQIWDNPDIENIDRELIHEIIDLFKGKTPILINNKWSLMKDYDFDGVHFDDIPSDFKILEKEINRSFIKGVTLTNDLNVVKKATNFNFDYFSFCAMFPSSTTDNCEIVEPKTVEKCKSITQKPIYLAGGITPENINKLKSLSFQGVAIVSGIMNATQPQQAFNAYENAIKN